ncbi:PREDICTED: receptor-like protein 12 [Camelina sativa]|uniref:Receptor-like protein 12 n=1 Tax=Camelina sativa TaxID=90675 RepID=A0ABM0XJ21_CAMSA|nr:PREDICTED: receptor-like protein 12 [Camelina sativa]
MKGFGNSTIIIPISLCFIFIFIYHFKNVLAAPTTRHFLCSPEQRDALLAFKNEFHIGKPNPDCMGYSIESHRKTESWGNNSDCCTWKGITCNAKSREVVGLDLRCSFLHGRFHSNSSLQNLPFLTTLDLSFNDFYGQVPSLIGNFPHLTTLNLSMNQLSGQIPSSIGNLSHLTTLRLSGNNFSGRIPSWIENLFHLTSLQLSLNNLSGRIPSWIGKLPHLTVLILEENNLAGEIPSSIGNLSHLTLLSLSGNNLVGEIPSSIGNLSQLTYLSLSGNNLVGEIPSSIGNLSQLTDLSIWENNLVGEIPSSFGNLNKMNFFHASQNAFTGTIPSSLFTIPSLTYIILSDNQLNGTLEFGNTSSLSNLKWLVIGNNNFKGPIPRSISKFVNLSGLELSHFDTQGRLVDFSIFSPLKSLMSLDLSYLNSTTTIDLYDILSYSKSLSHLDLSGNHVSTTNKSSVSNPLSQEIDSLSLSGCGITEFPAELLRTLHGMGFLDISNNKIEGQVPAWLWTLPNLRYVNLSNNTFNGFQRAKKKQGLSSVRKPFVSYFLGSNNNFTGKIPSFICEFRSLDTLDLSENNFNSSIPHCLVNLNNTLSVLNLRQNNLSGGLPEHIFESLRSFDVGHNQLVGKLPRSLIRFSTLEVLNVESNKINDTFPFWLGSLQKLQVLVLRSNAFHGPIHQASFPQLRIIDISHNHFDGTLPSEYFVKWSAMSSLKPDEDHSSEKYMRGGSRYYYDSLVLMNKGVEMELVRILKIYTAIDFSGNRFEGEIPKSIGLLKELHVLNLSNNAFTGCIPSSMGNLKALDSLDVSQNKLSGEIPQELGELSFLAYMDFSHNKLSGLVPGGTQFRTQRCSSFEGNLRLFGLSFDEICRDAHTPATKVYETSESEEEDEEVISWIAAAIGFTPGISFGFAIGYILLSYKPKWFMNPFGRNNRRRRSTPTH